MGFVSMTEILSRARNEKYAVGFFESWSLESMKAVINAAEESNSPVIIGFNGGIMTSNKRILKPEDLEIYGTIGRIAAEKAAVPVALILNEIQTLKLAEEGIRYGFNALMFECNTGDLEENIAAVKKIVNIAHAAGISVESNVGVLPSAASDNFRIESHQQSLTSPDEAKRFVEETGIDSLGVSIGNVEVLMNSKVKINFGLLEEIQRAVNIPLALHGGSGIADEDMPGLVNLGVCKMNLGAALSEAFIAGLEEALRQNGKTVSPKYAIGSGLDIDIMARAENQMKDLVMRKMKVYGSAGK